MLPCPLFKYVYIYILYIYTYSKQKKHPKSSPPPPRNLKNLHNVDRSSSVNSTSEIDRLLPPTFNLIHFHLEGLRTWMDVCFAVWMLLRNVYRAKIVRFHQPRTDPEISGISFTKPPFFHNSPLMPIRRLSFTKPPFGVFGRVRSL